MINSKIITWFAVFMERILNVACGKDNYGTDFVDMYPRLENVTRCNIEKGLPFPGDTFDEV